MSSRHLTGVALAVTVAAVAASVTGASGAVAAPGGNAALKAAEQSAAASTGDDLGLPADQSLTVRIGAHRPRRHAARALRPHGRRAARRRR